MKRGRKKKKESTNEADKNLHLYTMQPVLGKFTDLSVEIICAIFDKLSPQKILQLEHLSRKIHYAVLLSLKFRDELDFAEMEWDVRKLTALSLMCLSRKMPNLRFMYNIGTLKKCRFKMTQLLEFLKSFQKLEGVTIKDVSVLNSVLLKLKKLKVMGCFSNRERSFPPAKTNLVNLPNLCNLTQLHLVGCCVKQLPQFGPQTKHLYFRLVEFTESFPFRDFYAPQSLECFVMSHCDGPIGGIPYLPILDTLEDCRRLQRLELQRVPLTEGMIETSCSESWEDGGYSAIQDLTIGECKKMDERDVGFLIIASAQSLRSLRIQPSLSSNVLFGSLATAELPLQRPLLEHLSLGWEDTFPDKEYVDYLLPDVSNSNARETIGTITDQGMQLVARCFPSLESLEINKCPYLVKPLNWHTGGVNHFSMLTDLTIKNCPNINSASHLEFLHSLPELRYLYLENMFSEPPVGCSRVGIKTSMEQIGLFEKFPEHVHNLDFLDDFQGNQNVGNSTQNANVPPEKRERRQTREMTKEAKKAESLPKCTCPVEKKDNECQVDEGMLRKFKKQMKKVRIKMLDDYRGTIIRGGKKDKVIIPRPFQATSNTSDRETRGRKKKANRGEQRSKSSKASSRQDCVLHPCPAKKPETRDQHDSTKDPVADTSKDGFVERFRLELKNLRYMYLNNVGLTHLCMYAGRLRTIYITRCKSLCKADLMYAPMLTDIHVSQCRDLTDEPYLVNRLYGFTGPLYDKFVTLRPMHKFDARSFVKYLSKEETGTILILDYSPVPSETTYNKHRAKSWLPILERLTTMAEEELKFEYYQDDCYNENILFPEKHDSTTTGVSDNGSKWEVVTDVPLLKMLMDCPDVEVTSSLDPRVHKAGVYCPAAKGHSSLEDACKALRSYVQDNQVKNIELYRYNVMIYVNMCDVSGKAVDDPIPVL